MSVDIAKAVFKQVRNLFIWQSDEETFNGPEYWSSFADDVEAGKVFRGDCDNFALTCGELLARQGVPKDHIRIALCWVETGGYHAVCICDQHVLDNRQRAVWHWTQLRNYKWDKSMGLDEPGIWRKVT